MEQPPHNLALTRYFGESPRFDLAHIAVEADMPRLKPDWPKLLDASVRVAGQIAAAVPNGEKLELAAQLARPRKPGSDPLSPWVRAFAQVHGVPAWRGRIETADSEHVRLRIATPYPAAVERWVRLGLDLLWLSRAAADDQEVRTSAEAWEQRLARLGDDLPPREVMALHFALQERNIPWSWRGGDRTVVGFGSRQQRIRGVEGDPKEAVRRIVAHKPLIPIYTVTGSVGKTTTVRLIVQLLESRGMRLGIAESDGAWAASRRLKEGDSIGGATTLRVLMDPGVDAAVLEVGRGGILHPGIPYGSSSVAVLLNVGSSHVGEDGLDSVEAVADVKALSVKRGRIAVLNEGDAQCRRVGAGLDPKRCVWFGTQTPPERLEELSRGAAGALGIGRDAKGKAVEILLWRQGAIEERYPLEGVAPYHGTLEEKTQEELLAAVAAVRFGPVPIEDLGGLLPQLRLDNSNHSFRGSVYRRGAVLFLLDKAAEEPSLVLMKQAIEQIAAREKVTKRIGVFTRSALHPPDLFGESCAALHPHFDEFVLFDRPETYSAPGSLFGDTPGAIPKTMKKSLEELNRAAGEKKPIIVLDDWDQAQAWLDKRLAGVAEPVLVLINQPATSAAELNRRIVAFVEADAKQPAAKPKRKSKKN